MPWPSAAAIAANQANAQFSTGPRTPEGKARSSRNALKHGLTSIHLIVRPDEQEAFDAFASDLEDQLDPQGAVEFATFHDLLHAAWNLQRFRRIEAELATPEFPDPFLNPDAAPQLDRLERYRARTQRAYYRALGELRTLQTNRALRDVKLIPEKADEVPAIADINNLTKQTHSEVTVMALDIANNMVERQTNMLLDRYIANETGFANHKAQQNVRA